MSIRPNLKSRVCVIDRSSLMSGDTSAIDSVVKRVVHDLHAKNELLPWEILVTGYELDERHLAAIPEVRTWCVAVNERTPYLPLMMKDSVWWLMCVLPSEAIGTRKSGGEAGGETFFSMDMPAVRAFVLETLPTWLQRFVDDFGLSDSEAQVVLEKGLEFARFFASGSVDGLPPR